MSCFIGIQRKWGVFLGSGEFRRLGRLGLRGLAFTYEGCIQGLECEVSGFGLECGV